MNDEIKVIINYLDIYKNLDEGLLKSKDKKLLLDYITNLQQDNTMYARLKDEYEEEIKDLQQENQILKENAIHNDKVVDKAKWNETIYKTRIDKAIEYIEHSNYDIIGRVCSFTKLLKILKGDSND